MAHKEHTDGLQGRVFEGHAGLGLGLKEVEGV